jgi:hypothetical protein
LGAFDFEYWQIINKKNVHDVLLYLLKEKFSGVSEVLAWLNNKGVPYNISRKVCRRLK